MHPEISIVIPVYRNADTLRELRARISAVMGHDHGRHEIIFVDDACPEGSLEVLRDLACGDDTVAVISLQQNVGQNQAILEGLRYARGAVAVVLDADLQDPPEAIPGLLSALQHDTEAVFGGKQAGYESIGRIATARLFKWTLHLLSGRRIPVDAGLFIAMRRSMVDCLLAFDEAEPYLLDLMGRTGLRLRSVPVSRMPRQQGVSAYTGRMRLSIALKALIGMLPRSPVTAKIRTPVIIGELLGSRFTTSDHQQGTSS